VIDLEKRVSEGLVAAMKAKKEMELSTLRMLKAERHEAADQYTAVGAGDSAARELQEDIFLETYLPEQLPDDDLLQIVEEAGAAVKAAGPKDMGRVMGRVMAEVKGRADGKRVKAKVQEYLQSLVE